jgi:hypothetical protein
MSKHKAVRHSHKSAAAVGQTPSVQQTPSAPPVVPPRVTVVNITPGYARFLLDTKAPNRRVNFNHVARLAQVMRAGRWRLNGESIKLNTRGEIVDGQHRLEACVMSDQDFTTVFVEDVSEDAFETIDTGQVRSAGDILSIYNHKNGRYIAAAVRWVETLRAGRLGFKRGSTFIPPDEVCRIVEREPGIAECVNFLHNDYKLGKLFSASYGGAFLYLIKQIDEEKALTYINDLALGANLKPGDPALTVRDYLMRIDKRRVDSQEVLAVLIRGWNAFKSGANLTRVQGSVQRDGERTWPRIS